jgi:predicted Zn-dependent protease
VKNGSSLREFLASKIADSQSDKTDVMLAKYGISQIDRVENNYDKSLEGLAEVIDAYPEESILLVDKGVVEFESGRLQEALETLRKAYRRDQRDVYAAFSLANVYFRLNELEKAEELFLEVVEAIPEFSKVYFELGRLKAQQKRHGDSSYYLGQYYLYQGKHNLSQGSFRIALEDPGTDEKLKEKAEQSLMVLERIRKG